MRYRCKDPGKAKWYSDKGISCCLRWAKFSDFLEDMGERPAGTTLDRIDSSKGYYKENCRWASRLDQSRNLSNNNFSIEQARLLRGDFHVGLGYAELGRKYNIDRSAARRGASH